MNYNMTIAEISAKIDMYLEKERETEELVSKRLYEYVQEVMYASYVITRDKMNVTLGGGIAELGLIITGMLLSNNELIDETTELEDARQATQRDLDRMWRLVSDTLKNKKIDDIMDMLEINRQMGFKQIIIYLGIH